MVPSLLCYPLGDTYTHFLWFSQLVAIHTHVDHILLHCDRWVMRWIVVLSLNLIWSAMGVMPPKVIDVLASWKGSFGHHEMGEAWGAVPLCIMWTLRQERNDHSFNNAEQTRIFLKYNLLQSLYDWIQVLGHMYFDSFLYFIACINFFVQFVWGCITIILFFRFSIRLLFVKKKKSWPTCCKIPECKFISIIYSCDSDIWQQLLCCNYTSYCENFADYLFILIFRRGLITRNVKEAVDLFHQRFGVSLS